MNDQLNFRLTEGNSLLFDFIRGWSAQAVLLGHALYFFGIHGPDSPVTDFSVHRYAVAIFFLLSGFLITYSTVNKLQRKVNYGFKQYFIDRFSRIYTALVPALFFILAIDLLSRYLSPATYRYGDSFSLLDFVGNLFMLQYFPGLGLLLGERIEAFGSGGTLWTLSIEWWIYLFFGWALLRVFRKGGTKWLDVLIWIPLLIVPTAGFVGGTPEGLMILWLLGAVGYLLIRQGYLDHLRKWQLLLLIAWFAGLAAGRFRMVGEEYDAVLAFCTLAIILLMVVYCKDLRWPRWLAWLTRKNAAYSYTLYLIHYSILDLLRTLRGEDWPAWVLLVVGMLLSNLISAAIGLQAEVGWTRRVKSALYRRFSIKP